MYRKHSSKQMLKLSKNAYMKNGHIQYSLQSYENVPEKSNARITPPGTTDGVNAFRSTIVMRSSSDISSASTESFLLIK